MFNCNNKSPQFDIVIPVHKKDLAVLEYCIKAARKKIVGARRIITISKERYTNNAEWFPESSFPFDFEYVRGYTPGSTGWHFQQLLKLYSPLVIPDILPNVMILDSDTVFFKKTKMFDKKNRPFYNISKDEKICRKPFDIRVAKHIKKVWPEISRDKIPFKLQEFSGICHTMIFQRDVMLDLFKRVEEYDGSGDKFYTIFLKHADRLEQSVSEYQIYFNFLLIFYADKIALRRLKYKNTADLDIKKYQKRLKYHYCSFHSYLRHKKGKSLRGHSKNFFKKIFYKLFQVEIWNIGVAKCNISQFLTIPSQEIKWLSGARICHFKADPFGQEKHGEKFVFYEQYDRKKRKGKISALRLSDSLEIIEQKDVLDEKSHLSYPYIFAHDKKNYALIENHRANKLELFEVLDNQEFKKIRTIFEDLDVVDPSIIFYQNKFWLFFNLENKGDSELYLAYADGLMDEFKMHKKNPHGLVKKDIMRSRSAGEIFMHEGAIYRPAQNCLKSYGASIIINKIITLNENEFVEIDEIEIMPDQLGQYPNGLHTISSLGKNHTLIDGKRNALVFYKPLIHFCKIIKKIFCKKKS